MNKEQLETNMAALKLLQSETNDKVRDYQQQVADLQKQIDDYNKPELTPVQLDDIHNAIENAVNDYNFEDEGIYDKEFELDYDGRVNLSHININCTYELIETIVERVCNLFREAECPTNKDETNDK